MKSEIGSRTRYRRIIRAESVVVSEKEQQEKAKLPGIPIAIVVTCVAATFFVIGKNYIASYQSNLFLPTSLGGYETYDYMFAGFVQYLKGKSLHLSVWGISAFWGSMLFGKIRDLSGIKDKVLDIIISLLPIVSAFLLLYSFLVALDESAIQGKEIAEKIKTSKDIRIALKSLDSQIKGKLVNIDDNYVTIYMTDINTHVMVPKDDIGLLWKSLGDVDEFGEIWAAKDSAIRASDSLTTQSLNEIKAAR